jgi:hypothetical protein
MKKLILTTVSITFLCISGACMLMAYVHTTNHVVPNQMSQHETATSSFYEWKKACERLPFFDEYKDNPGKTALTKKMLSKQIDQFFMTMKSQLAQVHWINDVRPSLEPSDHFQAYVEKLIVPSDAIIAIHGDFHGDIRALNRFIETFAKQGFLDENDPFKIKDKNFYILFLGDYVDRGWYGAEVIYTILRLKNENPDRVFMVRGNHEEIDLNKHYGFCEEIVKKFGSSDLIMKIGQFYNFLPLALYIGAGTSNAYNIIQCCHGGIEIGFDPRPLLEHTASHAGATITTLMQKDGFRYLASIGLVAFRQYFKNDKPIDSSNGFMWNDFIVNPVKPFALSPRDGYTGTLFEYGKQATKELLRAWSGNSYQLRSIFRAHQHSDEAMYNRILNYDRLSHADDAGVGKLWIENSMHQHTAAHLDGVAVVTFSVAPDTGYGWPYQSFGKLCMAPEYKDWRLHVYQVSY